MSEPTALERETILAVLKESLSLNVKQSSVYTGGLSGGNLYEDRITIQLLLDGQVISEDTL